MTRKEYVSPKLVGEWNFIDLKVNVYYQPDVKKDCFDSIWQMRNPNSSYQGLLFRNLKTGEITYPEGAIIPEQTESDRELVPKALIIGTVEISETLKNHINVYLASEHRKRNCLNKIDTE